MSDESETTGCAILIVGAAFFVLTMAIVSSIPSCLVTEHVKDGQRTWTIEPLNEGE